MPYGSPISRPYHRSCSNHPAITYQHCLTKLLSTCKATLAPPATSTLWPSWSTSGYVDVAPTQQPNARHSCTSKNTSHFPRLAASTTRFHQLLSQCCSQRSLPILKI